MRILTAKDACNSGFISFTNEICRAGLRIFSLNGLVVSIHNNSWNGKVCICLNSKLLVSLSQRPSYNVFLPLLLACCGDVHPNPGPNKKILIGTYNVRGFRDIVKTRINFNK